MRSKTQTEEYTQHSCLYLRYMHLGGATTRKHARVQEEIAAHSHSIVQIPLNLVQNILRTTAKPNGASLRGQAYVLIC